MFGVNAELLIDHAWGWEPCTIKEIKAYQPQSNSISSGQVLQSPHKTDKARLIVWEMADSMALDLVEKSAVTDQLTLTLGYDRENLDDPVKKKQYRGAIAVSYTHLGAPEPITFAVGEDRTVETPADQLTRVGHTFAGWNTSAAGDGTMYEGVFTTTGFTDNTTLYAQWTPNTYTITFNANGGSGAPAQQSWVYADSGTIALSFTKPTRTGYTFQGWAASAAATSAAYQPGQAWNRSNTQSCTLYAVCLLYTSRCV